MIDFDHVLDAINFVTQNSEKYVIGNHFTDQSSMSLADWALFLSFKEDKTFTIRYGRFYHKILSRIGYTEQTIRKLSKIIHSTFFVSGH